MEIIGLLFLWGGVFFCITGVIGLIRMPDVYSRLHATGKVSTLGLVGLLIGAAILLPSMLLKAVALAIFVMITAPVASHAIASAAYRQGVPMFRPVRDDLAKAYAAEGETPEPTVE